MNQVQLQTLLAIIDEGSFELAALRLGLSASAVSQRIKALEKSLGRVLIRRSTPVEPTEAGEVILQYARQMQLLQSQTQAKLRGKLHNIALSVVVNADSLATWFQPVLAQIAKHQDMTVTLHIEDESHSLTLLRRGDVMGAVTREEKAVSGCEVVPLGSMVYYPVAHPDLLERYTVSGKVDWQQLPVLRFSRHDSLQEKSLEARIGAGLKPQRVSQIPSAEAFFEAARVGLGWAMLPENQALPLIQSGELVQLGDKLEQVPLYWQRWQLESRALELLSLAVVEAAQKLR